MCHIARTQEQDWTSTAAQRQQTRKSSGASSASSPGFFKPKVPTRNANSYCGRHSTEFLFGNISVTETVKGIFRRDSS